MSPRLWIAASDLHGDEARYRALWTAVEELAPECVLLAGDLLPTRLDASAESFVDGVLRTSVAGLRRRMGRRFPAVLLVLGNDDERRFEEAIAGGEGDGLWTYLHRRSTTVGGLWVGGYGCVPPTPFLLKDFERYDVSRYVDPGSVSPEEGRRTVAVDEDDVRFGTIRADLESLVADVDGRSAVLLCHAPPYGTALDRAGLDGRRIDHVPLDVHIGSVALRRLIEEWQPRLTIHGHVHEAPRLTETWCERLGDTVMVTAAHDGPETALLLLDPERPAEARRILA